MQNLTKTELKILSFIAEDDKPLYLRELAKRAKVSLGSASSAVRRLETAGFAKCEKKGSMKFIRADFASASLRQFKIFQNVSALSTTTNQVIPFCFRILLFGSAARGENNAQSDIDIMAITREKEKVQEIFSKHKKIKPILLTASEWIILKEKDKPLARRIEEGIELGGENGRRI